MKVGFIRMESNQPPISCLRKIIFSGVAIQLRQIALRSLVSASELYPLLQFSNSVIRLAICRKYAPELNMRSRALNVTLRRQQFAQIFFRLGKLSPSHVKVRQPDYRVRGTRIQGQRLFILTLGVGKPIFFFQKLPRCKMRLGLFGLKSGGMLVSVQSLVRLAGFDRMSQSQPGAVLALSRTT